MTKLEKFKEEFLASPPAPNMIHCVEVKPFTEDVYHGENGFRLTWNNILEVGEFYHIVPDLLIDVDVLVKKKKFKTAQECWDYFKNEIAELVDEKE